MKFQFVGGPCDGMYFDAAQIKAIGEVLDVSTPAGARQFVRMPPAEPCSGIVGGMAVKSAATDLFPYERTFLPGGVVQYIASSSNIIDGALASARQLLRIADQSQDDPVRRQEFMRRANEYITQVRAVKINSVTDVTVTRHWLGRDGRTVRDERLDMVPHVTVAGLKPDLGQPLAAALHLNAIIGNIGIAVGNAPTGFATVPGNPSLEGRIIGFDLEIGNV